MDANIFSMLRHPITIGYILSLQTASIGKDGATISRSLGIRGLLDDGKLPLLAANFVKMLEVALRHLGLVFPTEHTNLEVCDF